MSKPAPCIRLRRDIGFVPQNHTAFRCPSRTPLNKTKGKLQFRRSRNWLCPRDTIRSPSSSRDFDLAGRTESAHDDRDQNRAKAHDADFESVGIVVVHALDQRRIHTADAHLEIAGRRRNGAGRRLGGILDSSLWRRGTRARQSPQDQPHRESDSAKAHATSL